MEVQTEAAPYADHEHINIGITGQTDAGEMNDAFFSAEPLADELEPNQVAELVSFERSGRITGGQMEFGLGYNVSENDFIEQSGANQTTVQVPDAADTGKVAVYEEPGIIDFYSIGSSELVGSGDPQLRQVDFKEKYENGPFIDSTDNLDFHIEYSNQTGNGQQYSVEIQMVYAVHEVAQGVPQFSDPRRLMGD